MLLKIRFGMFWYFDNVFIGKGWRRGRYEWYRIVRWVDDFIYSGIWNYSNVIILGFLLDLLLIRNLLEVIMRIRNFWGWFKFNDSY